jgi:hypothetical protein
MCGDGGVAQVDFLAHFLQASDTNDDKDDNENWESILKFINLGCRHCRRPGFMSDGRDMVAFFFGHTTGTPFSRKRIFVKFGNGAKGFPPLRGKEGLTTAAKTPKRRIWRNCAPGLLRRGVAQQQLRENCCGSQNTIPFLSVTTVYCDATTYFATHYFSTKVLIESIGIWFAFAPLEAESPPATKRF